MAHRGGARHPANAGIENTAAAFRQAVELGYRYLETDVHATRTGDLLAFHDDHLDRVTDAVGEVARVAPEVIVAARIGGTQPIPRLADLLEEFPHTRLNIDIKSVGAVVPLADLITVTGSEDRVLVGSFSGARLNAFRSMTGGRVATSASPAEVAAYKALPVPALARLVTRDRVAALQVPHRRGTITVVTRGLVRRAHAAGVHVHVWTVDEPEEMRELLDLGVDGLISDRTDVLRDVLEARGQWCQGDSAPTL